MKIRNSITLLSLCGLKLLVLTPHYGFSQSGVMSGGTSVISWEGKQKEVFNGLLTVLAKEGFEKKQVDSLVATIPAKVVYGFVRHRAGIVQFNPPTTLIECIQILRSSPLIEYAEPATVLRIEFSPNDPYFGSGYQWSLLNQGQTPPGGSTGADISIVKAWDIVKGTPDVKIGVLDTGIPMAYGMLSHPDLSDDSRIIPGGDYTNDVPYMKDWYGHGTHVAGIIGATSNNNEGISGVAPGCKLLMEKIFTGHGLTISSFIHDALLDAVDDGAKILNLSLGGADTDHVVEVGIKYTFDHGAVCAIAAGNNYPAPPGQSTVQYPAKYASTGSLSGHLNGYTNILAVSATDANDLLAGYSSTGPEINVAAPGGANATSFTQTGIFSTVPNYPGWLLINDTYCPFNTPYGWLSGTSMAAPHVAGLAALIKTIAPTVNATTIRDIITSSADDKGTVGRDDWYGFGRINGYHAVKYAIEHYSTTIGGAGTTVSLHEDFNTAAGTTLTILPGTIVQLDANVTLNINGQLLANGTSLQPITLNRIGASGTWNGIALLSGSFATLSYCNFKNAYAALSCYTANANITNCSFNNSTVGVVCGALTPTIDHCTFLNDYFGLYISGCNPTITYADIENCSNSGIYLTSSASPVLQHNTLKNNSQSGIWFHGSSPQNLYFNTITGSTEGLYCEYSSSPVANYGCNVVSSSGGYAQVYANYNCHPVLGNVSNSGLNSFDGTPYTYVNANNSSVVTAEYNWWGTPSPNSIQFHADATSSVDWTHPLSSDPNPGRPKVHASGPSLVLPTVAPFSDTTFYLAYQASQAGRYDDALVLYMKVFTSATATPFMAKQALLFLGDVYERSGKADFLSCLATQISPRASTSSDLTLVVRELEAHWLVKAGRYTDAIAVYKGLQSDFSSNVDAVKFAQFSIGEIYSSDLNDHANATSALQAFVTSYPKDRLAAVASFLMSSPASAFVPSQQKSGGTIGSKEPAPTGFALESNYPNPFNPSTRISYSLLEPGKVSLIIYDALGREIANLADGYQQAGRYSVTWNSTQKSGATVSSGVYFARLRVLNDLGGVTFTKTSKLLLTK